jgi:sugar lactone lactonase YvrE
MASSLITFLGSARFAHLLRILPVLAVGGMLLSPVARAQGSYNGVQTTLLKGANTPLLGGVNVDGLGNVFVADPANNRILELPFQGGAPITLGTGLNAPGGVAVDNAGNVYIADTGSSRAFEVPWTGTGYGAQITLPTVGLNTPGDIEVDAAGNVFIADCKNDRVVELPAGGGPQVTVPVNGLSWPAGLGLDLAGDLFIADQKNNRIIKIPWTGTAWGAQTTVSVAGLNNPTGVSVDNLGNVFIADYSNNRVVEVPCNGSSCGAPTTVGSGFSHPLGAAVDQNRDLFVVDTGSNSLIELMTGAVNFGYFPVGTSSGTLAMNFTVDAGVTTGSFALVSAGGATTEFSDAGGSTCKAQTFTKTTNCVLNVKFTPSGPGLRRGGLFLSSPSGSAMGSWRLYGVGVGPEAAFSASKTAVGTTTPNLVNAVRMVVDGAGDLFVSSFQDAKGDPNSGSIIEYPKTTSGYGAPIPVVSGISNLNEVFLDGAGNLFFLSQSGPGAPPHSGAMMGCEKGSKGWGSVMTLASGLNYPMGLVLDENMDIFIAVNGDGTIIEIPRSSSGFGSPITVASGLSYPNALAFDAEGNLFATLYGDKNLDANTGSLIALPRKTFGFGAPVTLATGLSFPAGVAVDANDNAYVASGSDPKGDAATGAILEVPFTGTGFGAPVTLASGVSFTQGVALDGVGNVFFPDPGKKQVYEIARAAAPALSFAQTARGSVSTDSPQVVAVENIGNQPLVFSGLSYPPDFPEAGSSATDCTSSTTLRANGNCTLTIEFNPMAAEGASGSTALTEAATLTTNSLNAASATAQVNLTGTETPGLKSATTVALSASTTTPVPGVAITLTATVTGPGGTPTGTVSFFEGSTQLGKAATLANGVATTSATLTASGSVTAVYAGDLSFNGATSSAVTVTLTKAAPMVTLTASSNPARVGSSVTFSATVSTVVTGVPPTGTVQFLNGSAVMGTGTLNGGKTAYATSALPVGYNQISAVYLGDSKYQGATAPGFAELINKATPSVTMTASPDPATVGGNVTFSVTVSTVITGVPPTGTVQCQNGSQVVAMATLTAGKATCTTNALPVAANAMYAYYLGDGKYAAALSPGMIETVKQATPTVTLATSANPVVLGTNLTFSATVSTTISGLTPSGTVNFYGNKNVLLGTSQLNGNTATFQTIALPAGSNAITATYSGDANFVSVSAKALTETVNKATPTSATLTATPNPGSSTGSVVLSVTVLGVSGGPWPSGTVQFMDGAKQLGTGTLNTGVASYTAKNLAVGTHTINAIYGGDGNYAAATSNSVSEVISAYTVYFSVTDNWPGMAFAEGAMFISANYSVDGISVEGKSITTTSWQSSAFTAASGSKVHVVVNSGGNNQCGPGWWETTSIILNGTVWQQNTAPCGGSSNLGGTLP